MTCLRSPPISTQSVPGLIVSATRRFGIERLAQLVEVGDCRRVPRRTLPASGSSSPRMSRSRVVLPAPLGPMRPDLVAAHDARREIVDHDRPCPPKRIGRRRQLGDELPRALAGVERQAHAARRSRRAGALARAALEAAARGLRCGCAALPRPCGSRPLPAPRTCRSARVCDRLGGQLLGPCARS